ncbi:MAG: hypothetical protein M3O31_06030 [Acidobacteriota bacterium]|nr:hypothetical protein [Acidobacteriota bacterium]
MTANITASASPSTPDFSTVAKSTMAQPLAKQIPVNRPEPRSIADEIADCVGALTPLDAAALIETVQCMLTVAADEAVTAYKLSSAAVALAAVTALAENAIQAAAAAAIPAPPMYPLLRYTMENAGRLLSIEKCSFAKLKSSGRVKTKNTGGHPMVTHAELLRLADLDDSTPVNALRRSAAMKKKPVQKANLLILPLAM